MKKFLCVLLSALFFVFAAAAAVYASAEQDAVMYAEQNVYTDEAAEPDGIEDRIIRDLSIGRATDITWTDNNNRPMQPPKGGKIEWRWQTLGGRIQIEPFAKKPHKCTVTGAAGGWCRLEMRVLDAGGNQLKYSDMLVYVEYEGLGLMLNTLTGGLYDSLRMDFFGLCYDLQLLPYHYE